MDADNSKPSRVVGRPFEPGKSGNPGGRNPERERLRRLVLEYGEDSIKGIAKLATQASNEKVQLDALKWLAEQCIGKATQEITGPNGEPLRDIGDIRGILADVIAGKGR